MINHVFFIRSNKINIQLSAMQGILWATLQTSGILSFFCFGLRNNILMFVGVSHENPCIAKIPEKNTEEKYIHELEFQVGIYL